MANKNNRIRKQSPTISEEYSGNDFSASGIRLSREQYAISICAQLYLQYGIDAVKMTDIANASGIGVATLYRYFGTKPGITIKAATFLWRDVYQLFADILESEQFKNSSGEKQITTLFELFITLYKEHGGFLKFLAEFDNYLLQEEFLPQDLANYESSLIDFYPICEAAYHKGISDGSLRAIDDFYTYYCTFAHGLMSLCQKFIRGQVLPGDDFSHAETELQMMIDSAIYFLRSVR